MGNPMDAVEFETMLLGRYTINQRYPLESGLLERSAYLLLSRLQTEGAMSIGQLSDAFGLDTSTLNRQTGALLRAGLVERIPDPEVASPGNSASRRTAAYGSRPNVPPRSPVSPASSRIGHPRTSPGSPRISGASISISNAIGDDRGHAP